MTARSQLRETSGGGGTPPPDGNVPDDAFMAAPSRGVEIAIGAVALTLSLVAIYLSQTMYLRMGGGGIDARWWPTVLSSGAAVLSAIILGSALFLPAAPREDIEGAQREGWVRMLTALALSALYVFAWWQVGYVVPTLVYLFALLWAFGNRNALALLLYPVLTTAFIYGLFHKLLRIPL